MTPKISVIHGTFQAFFLVFYDSLVRNGASLGTQKENTNSPNVHVQYVFIKHIQSQNEMSNPNFIKLLNNDVIFRVDCTS